ncbi:Csu type fimbrial protein [Plastoroseomonas hellenica]|nr:spore coat U domain-containing protein [Plastoroseomonas hellenica]
MLLLVALILLLPLSARAQCTVTVAPVSFGTYLPFSATPDDATGSVRVACTNFAGGYTIALGSGGGTIPARRMASGSATLLYQLYTTAARTTIWGNGTGGSVMVSGSCLVVCSQTYSVYGRIPARQAARPGTYVDTIVVTVTF